MWKFIKKIHGDCSIGFYAIFIPVVALYAVLAEYVWDSVSGIARLLFESIICVGFSFLLVGVLKFGKWLEDKADKRDNDN